MPEDVGGCGLNPDAGGYGHLDVYTPELAISVKKDFRRREIGHRLMEEMIQFLKRQGYKKVSLSVSRESYAAFRLYQKLGFQIVPKGTSDEVGDDDFMVLELR